MNESLEIVKCPLCQKAATSLIDVDAGVRMILRKTGKSGDLPDKICSSCYGEITKDISQGVKLRLEQQAKEKNRHMVWKSRVNLIRNARQLMQQRAYSEAAINYEKYLRVLEIAYELGSGGLTPSVFSNSARSKELTVITSTYWDLFRIYDTNPQYRERMRKAATKLAEFIPFSPIYPDVIKKSQALINTAKNPDIVKEFLIKTKSSISRCFIATAAFENVDHPVVCDLRAFRDEKMIPYPLGRSLINLYYFCSPPIANAIDSIPLLRPPTRAVIRLIRYFALQTLLNPSNKKQTIALKQ